MGDKIAPLIGAAPGQVICCDITTTNLYKTLSAAVALRPDRQAIAVEQAAFPTDIYVARSVAERVGAELRLFAHHDELDEALAVGDEDLREKSMQAMRDLLARSGTIAFVSHSLPSVAEFCDRVLWLKRGRMRMLGSAEEIVDASRVSAHH